MNFEGSVVIVGVEGLEPPCDMPDLQSGAVAAVPYSQFSNYMPTYELVTVLNGGEVGCRTQSSTFSE